MDRFVVCLGAGLMLHVLLMVVSSPLWEIKNPRFEEDEHKRLD